MAKRLENELGDGADKVKRSRSAAAVSKVVNLVGACASTAAKSAVSAASTAVTAASSTAASAASTAASALEDMAETSVVSRIRGRTRDCHAEAEMAVRELEEEEKRAVLKLQAQVRSRRVRLNMREEQRHRLEVEDASAAAIKLQAGIRRRAAQRYVKEGQSATRIQARWVAKMAAARVRAERDRLAMPAGSAPEAQLDTVVGKPSPGASGRLKKVEKNSAQEAATARIRAHKEKERAAAAVKVQAQARGNADRKMIEERKAAAVKLQAQARGRRDRKLVEAKRATAAGPAVAGGKARSSKPVAPATAPGRATAPSATQAVVGTPVGSELVDGTLLDQTINSAMSPERVALAAGTAARDTGTEVRVEAAGVVATAKPAAARVPRTDHLATPPPSRPPSPPPSPPKVAPRSTACLPPSPPPSPPKVAPRHAHGITVMRNARVASNKFRMQGRQTRTSTVDEEDTPSSPCAVKNRRRLSLGGLGRRRSSASADTAADDSGEAAADDKVASTPRGDGGRLSLTRRPSFHAQIDEEGKRRLSKSPRHQSFHSKIGEAEDAESSSMRKKSRRFSVMPTFLGDMSGGRFLKSRGSIFSSKRLPLQRRGSAVRKIMKQRFRQVQQVQRIERAPTFRALPSILVVPNLEITLAMSLATGQMEAAAEMLVAYFMALPGPEPPCNTETFANATNGTAANSAAAINGTGNASALLECGALLDAADPDAEPPFVFGWLLLSAPICVFHMLWLFWIGRLLSDFYANHAKRCWVPLNKETELELGDGLVSDVAEELAEEVMMAKRLAKNIFTLRAAQRRSGSYECPEEDAEEPARTEQALAFASLRACFRLPTTDVAPRAGLSLDMLASFLGDGNPSRRGVYHACIGLFLQLLFAIVIGGLKRPGEANANIAVGQVILVATLQLLSALWSVCGDPSDKLLGFMGCVCSTCECISSVLLLFAHLSKDDPTLAAYFAELAIDFFKVSIYAPLFLTVNDTFIVPAVAEFGAVHKRAKAEAWSWKQTAIEGFKAVLMLPFSSLGEVLSILTKRAEVDEDDETATAPSSALDRITHGYAGHGHAPRAVASTEAVPTWDDGSGVQSRVSFTDVVPFAKNKP